MATPYTRNRERTIELVCETLNNCNLRDDGIQIAFTDEGWTYYAQFKLTYFGNVPYILAYIDDEGCAEILDVDGYDEEMYKQVVHDFIKDYFDNNDFMRDVKSF